jgi:polar amino acid transport system substrate-binding protein
MNTTFEQYLERNLELFEGARDFEYVIKDPDIRPFPSKDAAMAALAVGDGAEIDAVVTNLSTAQAAIEGGAPLRIVPGFLYWEPVAVAVDKGDPAFAARIDAAVQGMMADGTLSALSKKWFGIDLTTPTLQ